MCGGGIEEASVLGTANATGNSITLDRVTLDRNNAGVMTPGRGGALFTSPGNGGGLHIRGAGNVAMTDTTVADNIAANEGGGLWNSNGTLTITASTISGNESGDGGGIFNNSPSGDVILVNSTLSGNSAENGGGGILTQGGNVTLTSVTLALNDADFGGGIDVLGGVVTVGSSIIASNTAATGPDIRGTIVSADYNVVGNTSGATITGATGNDRLNVAARLSPLSDNGGPTITHALRPNSPALGNGNPAGVAVDQTGNSRPQGSAADSGAYESNLPASFVSPSFVSMLRLSDVDGSGEVTPSDALMVINYLSDTSSRAEKDAQDESAAAGDVPTNLDVNQDGQITALDALMVINSLNRSVDADALGGEDNPSSLGVQDSPFDSDLEQRRREIDDLLLEQLAIDAINLRKS